jgi:hypothetical protein
MRRNEITLATDRGKDMTLLLFVLWFFVAPGSIAATESARENPRTVIGVQLNAGETYVIKGLTRGAPAQIDVLSNPNALVVNSGLAGELMLVGAEAGRCEITAVQADGQWVTYDVKVSSIARPFSDPLAPGKSPPALGRSTAGFSPKPAPDWLTDSASRTIDINH